MTKGKRVPKLTRQVLSSISDTLDVAAGDIIVSTQPGEPVRLQVTHTRTGMKLGTLELRSHFTAFNPEPGVTREAIHNLTHRRRTR